MKKYLLGCCIVLTISSMYAQQDMQFTHYMYNKLYYNPAYAGVNDVPKLSFIHRSQWAGYSAWDGTKGSPSTQSFSGDIPLAYISPNLKNHGAGMNFVHDQLGPLKNIVFNMAYAKQIELSGYGDGTSILSFGTKIGFWSQSIDESLLRYGDLNDATISQLVNNGANQLKPDFSIGAFYESAGGIYGGISLNHAGRPNFSFNADAQSKLYRHMHIIGGYNITVNDMIHIKPKALISTDFKRLTYNLGGLGTYHMDDVHFSAGLNFRQSFAAKNTSNDGTALNNDAISLIIGATFLNDPENNFKSLHIGYSIDFTTTGNAAKAGTSHEIMFSYILPMKRPSSLNTPRYVGEED